MSKNYTTKTASLRATVADIRNAKIKQLTVDKLIVQGETNADSNGITLPEQYYKLVGREKIDPQSNYMIIDDYANEIYFTYKSTNKVLIDGSKMFMNDKTLSSWSQPLDRLEVSDNMFTNSSLVSFEIEELPVLQVADEMFLNSSLESFTPTTLPELQSANGMFSNVNLTSPLNISSSNLTETQGMFKDSQTPSNGLNLVLSVGSLTNSADMFNNCYISNIKLRTDEANEIIADKIFYGAKPIDTTTSTIDTNSFSGNITSGNNAFYGWNGKVEPNYFRMASLVHGQGMFSTTNFSNDKTEFYFSQKLKDCSKMFAQSTLKKPQITLSDCSNLTNRDLMFTGTTFTTGGKYIVIANSTPLPYSADFGYIILPNYTHTANYSGFFKDSIFDTEIRGKLNSLVDSDAKTNYSSMFENATFTSNIQLSCNSVKKSLEGANKGTNYDKLFYNSIFQSNYYNGSTINITINDDRNDAQNRLSSGITTRSMFENVNFYPQSAGGISSINIRCVGLHEDCSKIFKNAHFCNEPQILLGYIGTANEAFMGSNLKKVQTILHRELAHVTYPNVASLIVNANSMFEGCVELYSDANDSDTGKLFDMKSLKNANSMFKGCTNLSGSKFNLPVIQSAKSMFEGINDTPKGFLSANQKTTTSGSTVNQAILNELKDAYAMFKNCTDIQHPIYEAVASDGVVLHRTSESAFDAVNGIILPVATNLESMFQECTNLKSIDVYAPNATNAKNMLSNCGNITHATLHSTKLQNADSLFLYCRKLSQANLDQLSLTGNNATIVNGSNMFNCTSTNSIFYVVTKTNNTVNFPSLEIAEKMFDCTFYHIPTPNYDSEKHLTSGTTFNLPKLVIGDRMFYSNYYLNAANMILPKLQSANEMFAACNSLESFNTSTEGQLKNLVEARYMFSDCILNEDSVIGIINCLRNNQGLTQEKLDKGTYDYLLTTTAKATLREDKTPFSIGTMDIDYNANIPFKTGLLQQILAIEGVELIEETQNNTKIAVTNANNAKWTVNLSPQTPLS